jgi:hypothetical protein
LNGKAIISILFQSRYAKAHYAVGNPDCAASKMRLLCPAGEHCRVLCDFRMNVLQRVAIGIDVVNQVGKFGGVSPVRHEDDERIKNPATSHGVFRTVRADNLGAVFDKSCLDSLHTAQRFVPISRNFI